MAERLHAEQPSIYKDPNPKPEVAVALTDDFAACYGFATAATLAANFAASPTLQSIVGECTGGRYSECDPESADWLKNMIAGLFNHLDADSERLTQVITGLRQESEALGPAVRSIHQRYCLVLYEQYGNDIGIVFTYLMNIVEPGVGKWFLIDAGVPHCYLQGELMECMVNSDNVVRGGLTPKLKDSATLCQILPYESRQEPAVADGTVLLESEGRRVLEYYDPNFDELRLYQVRVEPSATEKVSLEALPFLAICIVLQGRCQIRVDNASLGTSTEQASDTFSTWYIAPGGQVTITGAADSTEPLILFIAAPKGGSKA